MHYVYLYEDPKSLLPRYEAKANIKASWDKRRALYGPTGRKSA